MVSSYATWSQVRQAYHDRPRLGGVFTLSILGRLITAVLASSGVEFNICLADILCFDSRCFAV